MSYWIEADRNDNQNFTNIGRCDHDDVQFELGFLSMKRSEVLSLGVFTLYVY